MSKILIVTNHSYMLWQFRRELIQQLLQENEVVISTPFVGHEQDFQAMGCKMINTSLERRGINPVTDCKLLRTYNQMLKKESPDYVITYSIKPNVYMGFLCRMKKVPYYVNVQGLGTAFQKKGLEKIVTIMYRTALKKAKTVFFENTKNAKIFEEKKITPAEQQTILPGAGVNLEYYQYSPYVLHDSVHFLYLGRIMKEKGVDELFQAYEKLHEKYGNRVTLDLVGFFEDEYKEQVEKLVAEGKVIFHGFQEDPRPYYRDTNCVVLPSYHEGMSNVLLEASSTGRAIITSDIPGCREAVDDKKSGYLCNVKDWKSLYDQMDCFMNLSEEEREAMGRAGRSKMEKEFDKKQVVTMTIEHLI